MSSETRDLTPDQSLTPEIESLHCAATSAGGDEAQEVEITAFIETLARIAHAVAARNSRKQQEEPET